MDCSKVQTNLKNINNQLTEKCKLVAVSKYREIEEIECAYSNGQKLFAENRVQALLERKENLPSDIEWHMIGHLQSNKVKYISPFIHTIHSVDSEKLLLAINKEAKKNDRIINCLLQIHIAEEESKFGFTIEKLNHLLTTLNWQDLVNVKITGLMAMASNTDNHIKIEQEFELVSQLHKKIKQDHFANLSYFKELSIGMSGDYKLALAAGSTMVRIGSGIFN